VFSIAMTLLVLELAVPESRDVAERLAHFEHVLLWKMIVYAMSFIVLGSYWVGHSVAFHYIIRADRPLMVWTVLFLLFVALVPFSTAFLGTYPFDRLAIGVYCVNLVFCGLLLERGLAHATKDPLMLHRSFDRRIFRGTRTALLLGPGLFTVALAVSFVNAKAAFVLCVAVPLLTFFPNPLWGRMYRRMAAGREPPREEQGGR
jgi:uncharacterized membrane protein